MLALYAREDSLGDDCVMVWGGDFCVFDDVDIIVWCLKGMYVNVDDVI